MNSAVNTPAPIIITASMGHADHGWASQLRAAHFPPSRNFLKAHITLFHHLPGPYVCEVKSALSAVCAEFQAPEAYIDRLLNLGRGVAFHVESPQLLAMRAMIAAQFFGLLIPQDQQKPRLHITIQNKVSSQEAGALYNKLSAAFEPRWLVIKGLEAHYYRGGPWEKIASYSFRGNA